MEGKKFKLSAEQIVDKGVPGMGCLATDMIMVEGLQVGFMCREEPSDDFPDSGWEFYSGTELPEYLDDAANSGIYSLNTVANYDPAIIPYLHMPVGTRLHRVNDDEFAEVEE